MNELLETGIKLAGATETAARAVIPLSGKGDKHKADQLAVESLRTELNNFDLRMKVVIGEGEKDKAPMLYAGELLGKRAQDQKADCLELIVDPLECTTNFALGLPDSMCVLLATPEGSVREIPGTYMEQLLVPSSVSPLLKNDFDLDSPVEKVLSETAGVLKRPVSDLTVVIQNRPRHAELIEQVRECGAGVSLIESGSISAALEILNSKTRRLTMLWGTFGSPEGLILAFMAERAGWGFLGRIKPHDDKTQKEAEDMGLAGKTLCGSEWIRKDGVLVMSGIHTSTSLLGVEYLPETGSCRVHTLVWSGERKYVVVHVDGVQDEIIRY